ncbi:MAG: ATP synthase subunit I [Myxococcota bacterium]|nr:ATP synthase subunit I [Myxococcota bacterium]
MERRLLKKIDTYVMFWGVLLVCGSGFFFNSQIFFGALFGALLACANWIGFRLLMTRFIAATARQRIRYGIFLGAKTLVMFSAVAAIVVWIPVNPIAFVIGLSALMLGIFTHSAREILSGGEAALKEDF